MVREDAYKEVQNHALAAWDGGEDLYQRASKAELIGKYLSSVEIDALFDISRHFKQVDYIFERALREIHNG